MTSDQRPEAMHLAHDARPTPAEPDPCCDLAPHTWRHIDTSRIPRCQHPGCVSASGGGEFCWAHRP